MTPMHLSSPTAMIIAGEASGDLHGAHLVKELRSMAPAVRVFGIGGGAMRRAGVEILLSAETLSVVGITEVATKLPAILEARRRVRRAMTTRRPQVLILIDFPDFNLHVAGMAKALGIPVLYYVSPQIWAWRKGRVKTIAERVDHMAVILPFEAPFYRRHGVPVTFVGHPLLDRSPLDCDTDEALCTITGTPEAPVVGLLPGSRQGEVKRLLPEMMIAARQIKDRFPKARFILSRAPSVSAETMSAVLTATASVPVTVSTSDVRHLFHTSTLVIAASGTVTLEAAIAQTPMVVAYRVSPLSYALGRALVRVPFISLVNLIADRAVVPELVQYDAHGGRMAEAAISLLSDPGVMADMTRQLGDIQRQLGAPGASQRVARIAWKMMNAHLN